jgi:hypothetical protein
VNKTGLKYVYSRGYTIFVSFIAPSHSPFYRISEKSGTKGNFNYFLIFIYRLKLKVKRLKMAVILDERVEMVLLSGRQGLTQR